MSLDEIEKALEIALEYIPDSKAFTKREIIGKALTALQQFRKDHVVIEGWQPIETAPSFKEVLGYDAATKVTHVTYNDQCGFEDPDSHFYSESKPFKPTHWMPLPKPPEAAALIAKQMGGE